ncbi:hypothetical protein LBMAG42_09900 [Deltaproteobacteria bacterium]|nr:hypothetical protein LBMAG42_09900 [Deltaproteobacteria bacterium]
MLTPNDIAAVPELEALAARMLPEVLATPRSAWVPMPAATMYKGDWLALLFSAGPWAQEFPGVDLAANLERFPEAAALLARHPEITVFGVLALAPGAELLPHRDRRADDEVRVHIPMQLGSADGAPWVLGKARLLDIRELHHSDDPGLQARITLVADVKVGRAVAEGEVAPWNPAPTR